MPWFSDFCVEIWVLPQCWSHTAHCWHIWRTGATVYCWFLVFDHLDNLHHSVLAKADLHLPHWQVAQYNKNMNKPIWACSHLSTINRQKNTVHWYQDRMTYLCVNHSEWQLKMGSKRANTGRKTGRNCVQKQEAFRVFRSCTNVASVVCLLSGIRDAEWFRSDTLRHTPC